MKRKLFIFVLLVALVTISGCTSKDTFTVNGYKITINKSNEKAPDNSYYRNSFIITDDSFNKKYTIDFIKNVEDDNNGVVYDIMRPEQITINNKKFDYYFYEDGTLAEYAVLHYVLPNNKIVIIEVRGFRSCAIDDSDLCLKPNPSVNEDVLNSKELASVLKFDIKEK